MFSFIENTFFFQKESQTRCTELESEKQRIQTDFDEYYQRTYHLEAIPNGTDHDQVQEESSSKG